MPQEILSGARRMDQIALRVPFLFSKPLMAGTLLRVILTALAWVIEFILSEQIHPEIPFGQKLIVLLVPLRFQPLPFIRLMITALLFRLVIIQHPIL
jgi:hypothetical protein